MTIKTSPWGEVQFQRTKAEGLIFVSTPGHGGYWVSPERWAYLERIFPGWRAFNDHRGWLEEDCDSVVAVIAWPDMFTDEACRDAIRMVDWLGDDKEVAYRQRWQPVRRYLHHTDAGMQIQERAKRFAQSVADMWEQAGMAGGGNLAPRGYWSCHFRHATTQASRTVIMPYPEKRFYTTAELDEFVRTAPEWKPVDNRKQALADLRRDSMPFNEADCGGAFDGFSVSSDADPGL